MKATPIIKIKDISKVYRVEEVETVALDHVSFTINRGEYVAIMGPSGSGKSTMLQLMGCLDLPSFGKVFIDGEDISLSS